MRILRDALLRSAPQDEDFLWRSRESPHPEEPSPMFGEGVSKDGQRACGVAKP
jgi:hypothetical protein